MKYLLHFLMTFCLSVTLAQPMDSMVIKQVDSLIQVSQKLTGLKQYEQALEVNVEAERLAMTAFGKESAVYGLCCFNHGRVEYYKTDYPEAEKWYLESKAILEKTGRKKNLDYANSLNNLAVLYRVMGQFEKAEPLYLEYKDIVENALGKEHPDYAWTLNNMANLYWYMGQYEKAEQLYLESKDIMKKVLGKEHPDYARSLNNLANLYMDMGQFEKAELLYLESKDIWEKSLGKEHHYIAMNLNNLAMLYRNMGQYEKAEPLYLESKGILEIVLGNEHPDYASNLNNLADLYRDMGQYEKAEPLYLESRDIWEKVLGKEHPEYGISLNSLAILYDFMGQYEKAELLYLESKDIWEKSLGKEHPDYASSLNNLATIYDIRGQYEKAELLYLESKDIREKALGKEHPDYASSLNNLATLYQTMSLYEKAEPLYLESKGIREKALGKGHPDYAWSLNGLANLYRDLGQYEKAEPLYLESKNIWEKSLGKEHPDYAWSLNGLANLYYNMGQYEKAESLYIELSLVNKRRLEKASLHLSERELHSYLNTFSASQNKTLSFTHTTGSNPLIPTCYNNCLFYKGFLLQEVVRLRQLALSDTATTEKFNSLKGYHRRLAALYSMPVTERKGISELEEKANRAEKELAHSAKGYADANRQLKWQDVKAVLKPSEAAIEFVHFKFSFQEKSDSIMYAALLLMPEDKQPKFIRLFEEKSLDSLLNSKSERKADYVNNLYTLADRGAVAVEAHRKSLYEILWKPLEKQLTHVNTIYFSPSGLLHRINLDAIPINETETLADRYKLIELNSTRQLVIPTTIKNVNNDAVLYGGIQYEQDSMFQSNEPLMASRSRGELSFSNVDNTLRGGSWNYLAGTEREVNSIEKIMQSNGVQTKLKKGFDATEESFKNLGSNKNPSPRILHIATHGYFFPDSKNTAQKSKDGSPSESVFKMNDHPMLRSGLIMSGGNVAWQGKPTLEGREDGVLTAYEISQMNLSNTELVVLSACETGLGDIQGNEGVYGLQRAFKIAGVKYIIMSLWQVPDKQTSLLMTTFYKKWIESKMNIPDAFHAAQKELRDNGLDPYNWAGFVLVE
ncbi:MAG: CHAT domain-containing protein [Saprospiraceae bacterium]|nr:CHAT domain-containing protein [Saprospiraceae bacterium]